jgi:hypothetical protein
MLPVTAARKLLPKQGSAAITVQYGPQIADVQSLNPIPDRTIGERMSAQVATQAQQPGTGKRERVGTSIESR